jgi:phosphopantothenoylcysteine decarboxylase/phosphopantothenate--cysteine ligase
VGSRLRFLILSGPTREHLDPVRYLSNASSGRQGFAIAEEALRRGHEVEVVLGPVEAPPPAGVRVFPVVSALDMLLKARERHPACDVLVGVAAVSDYRPARPLAAKRRRESGSWTVELVPTEDILLELGKGKGPRVHVGFALESEDEVEGALRKLRAKRLDWIVANSPAAIGAEAGEYVLLGATGVRRDLGRIAKHELAARLLDAVESSAPARSGRP